MAGHDRANKIVTINMGFGGKHKWDVFKEEDDYVAVSRGWMADMPKYAAPSIEGLKSLLDRAYGNKKSGGSVEGARPKKRMDKRARQ